MADQLPERSEVVQGVRVDWLNLDTHNGFQIATTLPQGTPEERGQVLDLLEAETTPGEDLIGTEFYVSHYIIHPIKLVSEATGEVVDCFRTVLPQPDGKPIAFVSTGVLESLKRLSWKEGHAPPFDPPIKVKLRSVSLGGGRRTYKFVTAKG